MIEIKNLNKSFGSTEVLENINIKLEEGKIYGLLGRNGVGKTTLLSIMANLIKSDSGRVLINGENIYENSEAMENIAIVKESGFGVEDIKLKKILIAAENLYKYWDEVYAKELIKEFELDIKKNYSKLSRGNQTIVGLIIGLASRAPLTLFDEPSLGLAPLIVKDIFEIIEKIRKEGVTILLIEQNANMALKACDWGYVMETGNIKLQGKGLELLENQEIKEAYLGKSKK